MTTVKSIDVSHFERKLRARADELRKEIRETSARRAREQFRGVAGEVADVEDAALADVVEDTNDAEIGRDTDELREIDEALGRVAAGSYGICLRCGKAIEPARLEAAPTAKRHQRCQELDDRERGAMSPPTL